MFLYLKNLFKYKETVNIKALILNVYFRCKKCKVRCIIVNVGTVFM